MKALDGRTDTASIGCFTSRLITPLVWPATAVGWGGYSDIITRFDQGTYL